MKALILNLHHAVLHEFSLPWHIYDFVGDYILGLGDIAKKHLCIVLAELWYSLYIYIFLLKKKKKKLLDKTKWNHVGNAIHYVKQSHYIL